MCKKHESIELVMEPDANIVCFRFDDKKSRNLNEVNGKIRSSLLESGEYYIVQTELGKELFLRVSVMNPLTKYENLEKLLDRVTELGEKFS